MLKVRIDLYPMGSSAGKREIAEISIANVGMDEVDGSYAYVYYGKSDNGEYEGKVYGHVRENGVYTLLEKVSRMITMNDRMIHNFTEYDKKVINTMKEIR